jgi:hypothetical protein
VAFSSAGREEVSRPEIPPRWEPSDGPTPTYPSSPRPTGRGRLHPEWDAVARPSSLSGTSPCGSGRRPSRPPFAARKKGGTTGAPAPPVTMGPIDSLRNRPWVGTGRHDPVKPPASQADHVPPVYRTVGRGVQQTVGRRAAGVGSPPVEPPSAEAGGRTASQVGGERPPVRHPHLLPGIRHPSRPGRPVRGGRRHRLPVGGGDGEGSGGGVPHSRAEGPHRRGRVEGGVQRCHSSRPTARRRGNGGTPRGSRSGIR